MSGSKNTRKNRCPTTISKKSQPTEIACPYKSLANRTPNKFTSSGGVAVVPEPIVLTIAALAVYPSGTTCFDFGLAELGLNFATGKPGTTLFGGFFCLPEPSGILLACVALLGVVGTVRRG